MRVKKVARGTKCQDNSLLTLLGFWPLISGCWRVTANKVMVAMLNDMHCEIHCIFKSPSNFEGHFYVSNFEDHHEEHYYFFIDYNKT